MFLGVVLPVPDGVDEALSLVRFLDRQVQDAFVVDFQKLRQVFGDEEVVTSLDSCRR